MSEDEAQAWVVARYGAAALETVAHIRDIVVDEAGHQNLVAPSTLNTMWARHIVDSAQLLTLLPAPVAKDLWLDIGSGAGFPGLVIAALANCQVTLVEPRKRRAEFLMRAAATLRLSNASVACCRVEALNSIEGKATMISARAVAPLGTLFGWASACATSTTRWVLPKGQSAREEVASAQQAWHGVFHVKQSITDPESMIVLASGVTRR